MAVKRSRVFVDSIDGEICTILVGREKYSLTLPLGVLPKGTSEGDCLIMTMQSSDRIRSTSIRSVWGSLAKLEKDADLKY